MACGRCGNKRNPASGANIAKTAPLNNRASTTQPRQPVRVVARPTARKTPDVNTPRPLNRLRYFLKAPDGTEEVFNTLAEAQEMLRRHGGPRSGYVIEPRREST